MYLVVCFVLFSACSSLAVVSGSLWEGLEGSDIRALRVRLEEEKAKRLLLQNDVEVLMVKMETLERRDRDRTESAPSASTSPVYFTARLTETKSVDQLHVMTFDDVISNQGGGYSAYSGIFTAPRNGTYLFTVSALTPSKKNFHLQLLQDGKEIGRLFAGDPTSSWGDHASVTIATNLAAHVQVYVRHQPGRGGDIYGNYYTTFTGILVNI